MDYRQLTLAAVTAWVADGAYALTIWTSWIGDETTRFPGVFRPMGEVTTHMPLMFAGSLVAMFVLATIYAKGYEAGGGLAAGLKFGLALALFMLGFVSVGIYGAFNIDGRLAMLGFAINIVEMLIIGAVIGLIYRPVSARRAAGAQAL